jgi:Wax ester synthase-like Acyl-CoA acyltransferase domain
LLSQAVVSSGTPPSCDASVAGDERDFLDWISDFYSHRLDRSRPLWEMVLLDGLADGRWALVWKTRTTA